jgi:hypothetical protein
MCADLSTYVSEVAIMGTKDIPLLQKVRNSICLVTLDVVDSKDGPSVAEMAG